MSELQPRFDFDADAPVDRDAEARRLAVDPRRNVALEASAGTGKTRVLVDRYVGLLLAQVKPRNILAMTFTRKAAAEMRQRILQELARRHREGSIPRELWQEIRDSLADVAISTIDAFCLSLLREFPLEADVDPGFELADETETPRLVGDALERTLRTGRAIAAEQPEMALLFAELGEYRLRAGLARLIDRRLVVRGALHRFVQGAEAITIDEAVARLLARLRAAMSSVPGGAAALLATGPDRPEFVLFARDLQQLLADPAPPPPIVQALLERVRGHLLTRNGEPRKRLSGYRKDQFRSAADYEGHLRLVTTLGAHLADALREYRRDINLVLARAVRQLFAIALQEYERTLHKHGVMDFSQVLERTLALLGQMEEFSRSRYKLESRYQHVLVDEFQDTSRAQWELVERLVQSWAAGAGASGGHLEPSIFIVGDRKQSIYGFRDADVAVLDEAARFIDALRPIGRVRTAITRSFRSVRELLHFVNDLFAEVEKAPERRDAFRYSEDDAFPLDAAVATGSDALGIVTAPSEALQAEAVADEIARLLVEGAVVRDRDTGVRRPIRPGDIAVLFRTREGHRAFEDALSRRRVPFYVYKGLGFFDADEIKDVLSLLALLARPHSDLHAAAFLRSRFVGLSDEALKLLAPRLAASLTGPEPDSTSLHPDDRRRLLLAREAVPRWLALADRVPPAELLDMALADSAYAAELAGPSYRQARENLKKIRAMVRRIQNRGYATLERLVDHFTRLGAGGDESNAIVDAMDAVNLMTAHAAKGLEFPVVFVVNLHRGSGGAPDPIRVTVAEDEEAEADAFVSVGEHESEADKDLEAREAEEAKRLLYVALTRARDRLYLAAALNPEGRFVPGKGGLGQTLPASFASVFERAGQGIQTHVTWAGGTATHTLRVVMPETTAIAISGAGAGDIVIRDDFAPLGPDGRRRVAVTDLLATSDNDETGSAAPASSIEAGVLVHRALAWGADDPASLLRDEERALLNDPERVIERARRALHEIRAHPDLAGVFDGGEDVVWRRHEVPFSIQRDDRTIVRGTIDCLVKRASGLIQVLEFKTGRPLDAHRAQLALYVDAAKALFPGTPVEGRLLYAGE